MENEEFVRKLNIIEPWHSKWVEICENRTDYDTIFSTEQREHFEYYLNGIDVDNLFIRYSIIHKYIDELHGAIMERTDLSLFDAQLDLHKWKQLNQIFFHYYYNEFLDANNKEAIQEYLNPKEYNPRYELLLQEQFLSKPYPVDKQPIISLFAIDKAIIQQMERYEGGEKLAFLKYQYTKFSDINERSISLQAFLEEMRKKKQISKSAYQVGKAFIEKKIETHRELDKPIKTNLTQKQIGFFYRLVVDSSLTISTCTYSDFFNLLSISHMSADNKFPTVGYLKTQTVYKEMNTGDKARLTKVLSEMQEKLKNIPT